MKTKNSDQDCPYARPISSKPITDDEIHLFEVFRILWARRLFILSFSVLGTLIAVIFIFFVPKVYKTKMTITQTTVNGDEIFAPENIDFMGRFLTSQEVWNTAVNTIMDKHVQTQFWENFILGKKTGDDPDVQMSKASFLKNLSIRPPNKRDNDLVIAFSGNDPEFMNQTLLHFVAYVKEYSRSQIMDKVKQKIERERLSIKAKIEYLQIVNKRKIDHELTELKKRKEIEEKAQRLQLQRQAQILREQRALAETLGIVKISNNCQNKPLYALGTKALQAEIDMLTRKITSNQISSETLDSIQFQMEELKNQESIDIFQKEQEQLYWLNKIDLNTLDLNVFYAGRVLKPQASSWSKPERIVLLCIILGLMLAIFIETFIVNLRKWV